MSLPRRLKRRRRPPLSNRTALSAHHPFTPLALFLNVYFLINRRRDCLETLEDLFEIHRHSGPHLRGGRRRPGGGQPHHGTNHQRPEAGCGRFLPITAVPRRGQIRAHGVGGGQWHGQRLHGPQGRRGHRSRGPGHCQRLPGHGGRDLRH